MYAGHSIVAAAHCQLGTSSSHPRRRASVELHAETLSSGKKQPKLQYPVGVALFQGYLVTCIYEWGNEGILVKHF